MSIRDYIWNIAPAPAELKALRDDAKRKGTSSMSMREIDREIASYRREKGKPKTKKPED
jgi:hypothetical protein